MTSSPSSWSSFPFFFFCSSFNTLIICILPEVIWGSWCFDPFVVVVVVVVYGLFLSSSDSYTSPFAADFIQRAFQCGIALEKYRKRLCIAMDLSRKMASAIIDVYKLLYIVINDVMITTQWLSLPKIASGTLRRVYCGFLVSFIGFESKCFKNLIPRDFAE